MTTPLYQRPLVWIILLLVIALFSWGTLGDVGQMPAPEPPVPNQPLLPGQPGTVPIPTLGPDFSLQQPGIATPESNFNPQWGGPSPNSSQMPPGFGVGNQGFGVGQSLGPGSATGPFSGSTQPGAAGTVPGQPAGNFGTTGIPLTQPGRP